MREILEKVLQYAINAPSGENLQPWSFGIKNNKIYLINSPETDKSLYNFRQFGSLVGHGALIENIAITATKFGYRTEIEAFPKGTGSDLVAVISFISDGLQTHPLYGAISKRTTNRKPYAIRPLTNSQKEDLLSVKGGGGRVVLIDDAYKKSKIAKALSINERLILDNFFVHKFLFDHITWTEEEEKNKKSGLFVKTLELSSGQEFGFKLFRNWGLVRIINKMGLPGMFAKEGEALYNKSGAIGAVLVPGNSENDFVLAGRLMERVWLKATVQGLSIQPVTAVVFLKQRIIAGAINELSSAQVRLIEDAFSVIKENFNFSNENLGMMFRIGEGGEPAALSSKKPPHILSDSELLTFAN